MDGAKDVFDKIITLGEVDGCLKAILTALGC
jgi:hypothetical protein